MIKLKEVFVLEEAVADLNEGKAFYNRIEPGVGVYFWDCIISYNITVDNAYVIAVLPMRRNPEWIKSKIRRQ